MVTLTACTSNSGTHTQSFSPSPSDPTTTRSSSPSTATSTDPADTPQAQAAKAAYISFEAASRNAERKPDDLSRREAIAAHAIEPALTNEAGSLVSYAANGIAWAGSAPTPRVSVKTVAGLAKPYPRVTLADCPTASLTWKPYDSKTHKPVPVKFPGSNAPLPHAITAIVIYYDSRWVVQKTVTEVTKTCAPS